MCVCYLEDGGDVVWERWLGGIGREPPHDSPCVADDWAVIISYTALHTVPKHCGKGLIHVQSFGNMANLSEYD